MPGMMRAIAINEGVQGLYRGFVPSCLKNMPNKGIRLSTFDAAKSIMSLAESSAEEDSGEDSH